MRVLLDAHYFLWLVLGIKAVELAVCFANAEGGLTVFGVKDRIKGRANAVTSLECYDLDVWGQR